MQEELMARLTLEIPDDTHRRLKTLAAYFGMSMKDFLISRALAPAERSTPPSGLPEMNAEAERLDHLLFSPEATFKLSPENWEAFQAALDAPPSPNAALRKLMTAPTRFDEP
ncbi:MAG: DUF1778 domain-containing protein [Verrucomicrobiaceae bacterium]|nr:MAG: DUF1778 domain-containing protein [Verrucomicrobiaceae bacterium]